MAQSSLNAHNVTPDKETRDYHLRQWNEPYRSTIHFCNFIADKLYSSKKVVDLCCGAGAPTGFLSNLYPEVSFLGLDISEELIGCARHAPKRQNLEFEVADAENLQVRFGIDGVTMMQTLHTMPDPSIPLHQIATRLRPKWLALSTLVYEGNINCKIVVSEPMVPRMQYYNVLGLPGLAKAMFADGYILTKHQPFKIDVDLPPPSDPDVMGTYTINTENGRLQCSGPLILPWGFLMFERHAHTD